MRPSTLIIALAVGTPAMLVGCTNEPQYVPCAPMGAAMMDTCTVDADGMSMEPDNVAHLHVPIKPDAMWSATDRDKRAEIQKTVDPAVIVPIYRLEQYDLSVEWHVTNLEDSPGQFRIDLNGANEEFTYDPLLLMPPDPEDPPAPPLAGNIPIDIAANGTMSGVFREDQLLEAAIDLDQITRGNVHPFAAMLTISKNADSFQPLTMRTIDPVTGDTIPGVPTGPAIPRVAFRQLVRVDLVFHPDHHMKLEFELRVREHTEVIHEKGLNAPAGELNLLDPAGYAGVL